MQTTSRRSEIERVKLKKVQSILWDKDSDLQSKIKASEIINAEFYKWIDSGEGWKKGDLEKLNSMEELTDELRNTFWKM